MDDFGPALTVVGEPDGPPAGQVRRGLVLAGLMLSMGLAAMDVSVVATAIPSVVRDLGGFSHFPWVFTSYLLAIAVTTPIYGRLADLLGRKSLLLFGIAVFLSGSLLCGFSWNLASLVGFRAVQGLGAGALRPLTSTIAGDLYSVRERGRVQGLLGSVWAVAAVLGPLVGGLFTQFASWRWIFFVNLPVGMAALLMISLYFRDTVPRRRVRIDYLGVALLVAGIGSLVYALLQSGTTWSWRSPQMVAVLAAAAVALVAFAVHERHAAEPILPPWVYQDRLLTGVNLATMAAGLVVVGMTAYLPTFAQGVMGASPFVAGAVLGALSVGWPAAAAFSARLYLRFGFRDTALFGAVLMIVAGLVLAAVPASGTLGMLAVGALVLGAGLGLVTTALMVGAQSVVDITRRGVVTGSISFSQMLGSTLSAAVFGSIFNSAFSKWLLAAPATLAGSLPSVDQALGFVRSPQGASGSVGAYVREGLYVAGHRVFLGVLVMGVVTLIILLTVPRWFRPIAVAVDTPAGEDA